MLVVTCSLSTAGAYKPRTHHLLCPRPRGDILCEGRMCITHMCRYNRSDVRMKQRRQLGCGGSTQSYTGLALHLTSSSGLAKNDICVNTVYAHKQADKGRVLHAQDPLRLVFCPSYPEVHKCAGTQRPGAGSEGPCPSCTYPLHVWPPFITFHGANSPTYQPHNRMQSQTVHVRLNSAPHVEVKPAINGTFQKRDILQVSAG